MTATAIARADMDLQRSILDAALEYVARGWPVLPVHVYEVRNPAVHGRVERNKVPLIKDWPNTASCEPNQIREWFGPDSKWQKLGDQLALGLVTGPRSGLYVVDFDPRNGATVEVIKSLRLPQTLTASTISDGWHHYFTHHEPLRNGKIADGVDFRGDRGFVVAPQSKNYSWVDNGMTRPVPLPQHILEKLHPAVEGPDFTLTTLPDFEEITRFDGYAWSFYCDATDEQPIPGTRFRRVHWFLNRCAEVGLTPGQIRTAVWNYPPALNKEQEKPGWINRDLRSFLAKLNKGPELWKSAPRSTMNSGPS